MKILYIAKERRAAQIAAHALRGIAPNVTVTWARTLGSVLRWAPDNRDAAAVVIEAEVEDQGCASVVQHLRGLGLATPVVVVPPEHLGTLLAALKARLRAIVDRERTRCADLDAKLAQVEAAREEAEQRYRSELASAAARLAEREAQHQASLARDARICTGLQSTLFELEAAVRSAEERRATEAAAAADRQAALEDRVGQDAATRAVLEQKLAAAEAARREANQQHAAEMAALGARLEVLQGQHDASLEENAAARAGFERQLIDAAETLENARQERATEAAAAAEREREALERLHRESAIRTTLEHDLDESRRASANARRRFVRLAAAARRRGRENKVQLAAQLAFERTAWERALAERHEEIRQLLLQRTDLERLLAAAEGQVHHLNAEVNAARHAHERDRVASASELERLSAEYDRTRQSLERLQAAYDGLHRAATEQAAEHARLESVAADRDTQLTAQLERHRAAQQAAEELLAQTREELRQSDETGRSEIARLQRENDGLRRELQTVRTRAEALRVEADKVPVLLHQLEDTRRENRRQFERAPYALFECTSDGRLTRMNHSLVRLLGYRRTDDLRGEDFAAAAFECPGDLRWLLERSVKTKATESVETTLKTRDRRRVHVRLHALTTPDGSVEVSIEDLTSLQALEQRLRQAQRLEAVGRLASEVAVTCDALLRDVTHDGQQWLAAIGTDTPLRQQGELLLGEVARAAGFLRQFAVYGNKQVSAPDPVSVPRVLRDLEPVLKRVAGDDIDLLLPKTGAPFDVDVEAERLERILVNVASYARQRMPYGGRVKIDLATTVVDRRFVAKYPNVRPGNHVLITVAEMRGAPRPVLPIELREPSVADAARSADRPGVDLGVLLGLVGGCGGHLWMAAEPSGNMTLKIHLPRRVTDEAAESAARAGRGRHLVRWFRQQAVRD